MGKNKTALRAIVKYPGAKWRIADWIIAKMPPHKSYLEPYFGSGAVFFRKPSSRIETINDIDDDVINLFRVVRDSPEELARRVEMTPFARDEYNNAFVQDPCDPLEQARMFLLKTWQGHGFRTCHKSGWKNDISGREYAYAVRYWNELPRRIIDSVCRLKEAQIEQSDAIALIKRFNRSNVLIYADPPYLLSTRKMKKQYINEMSEDDHVKLLETLLQHEGPVMLSGYDSDLYNGTLQGWYMYEIDTLAEKGKPRTEVLWTNFNADA